MPAGGNGTISLIGRDGKDCAEATPAESSTPNEKLNSARSIGILPDIKRLGHFGRRSIPTFLLTNCSV